jgi:O-antigen ligase
MNLWQSAVAMWRDHPVLGVGPDNFLYAYRGYYILPAAWQEPNLSHAHNFVLDFATRLGVLGLLVGLGMAAGIIWLARIALVRTRNNSLHPLAIGLVGMFAYVVAHGLVDHSLFLVDLAFVFMLACGLLALLATSPYDGQKRQQLSPNSNPIEGHEA